MLISKYTTKRSFSGYQQGFTLIELLVVIAIIGILASVVLASLNTARTKGQIASIKSNLKNIIPQAELAYDVPGNYSTVCTDTKVAGMLTAITNAGGTASCYSYDNARWGASAKLNSDSTQNLSVDSTGVVTWDTTDKSTGLNWNQANAACTTTGGKLPSLEELEALYLAYSGTPTGFLSGWYWSSTLTSAGSVYVVSSYVSTGMQSSTLYNTRCVH